MLLDDSRRWRIIFFIYGLFSLIVISGIATLIYFVVIPNSPEYGNDKIVSFVLGILASLALALICLFIGIILVSLYKNNNYSGEYPVTTPIKINSHTSYRTEKGHGSNEKRKGIIEPVFNVGFIKDEEEKSCSKANDSRSSFAEDLYKSFKALQAPGLIGESAESKRRKFLASTDDEGYHFDSIDLHDDESSDVLADSDEINTDSFIKKNPLQRLDTFDKSIIGVNEFPVSLDTSKDVYNDNGESDEVTKRPLTAQDSFKGLERFKSFDKYLSLVRLDSFIDLPSPVDEEEGSSANLPETSTKPLQTDSNKKDPPPVSSSEETCESGDKFGGVSGEVISKTTSDSSPTIDSTDSDKDTEVCQTDSDKKEDSILNTNSTDSVSSDCNQGFSDTNLSLEKE